MARCDHLFVYGTLVSAAQSRLGRGERARLFREGRSLGAAFVYFVMKMLFWYDLPIGIAPLIIGLFCVSSVQLFFLGVLGEYVGSIYTQVRNHPHVFEKERINFSDEDTSGREEVVAASGWNGSSR